MEPVTVRKKKTATHIQTKLRNKIKYNIQEHQQNGLAVTFEHIDGQLAGVKYS